MKRSSRLGLLLSLEELGVQHRTGYWGAAPSGIEGVKVVRNGDLDRNGDVRSNLPVRSLSDCEWARAELLSGDVLVTTSGDIGKCAVWGPNRGRAAASNFIRRFRPNNRILGQFLYYYFRSQFVQEEMARAARGVTIVNLPSSFWDSIQIPCPPVSEQEKLVATIEAHFSRLDDAVSNLQRVKVNLKRYKAAVLKAAVEGWLVPTEAELARGEGREFDNAEQLLQRILDVRRRRWAGKGSYKEPAEVDPTDAPPLPTGWVWATLNQIAEIGTGATPKRDRSDFYEKGEIPWVTSAVVNEPFVDSATEFVTEKALAETNLTLFPPGTLLVAMYGEGKTRGKCSELRIASTTNQALAGLQVDVDVREYLKLFLDFNYEQIRTVAAGGVQPNLNLGLLKSIRVPLPPRDEQKRIVAETSRQLTFLSVVERELDRTSQRSETLRASVLNSMFRVAGQTRT